MGGVLCSFVGGSYGPAPVEATGGDEIQTIGDYKYHVFSSSGTLNVTNGGTIEVVSVGGGGGGGDNIGGGGGGAELDILTAIEVASGNYSITIGAGGYGRRHSDQPAAPGPAQGGSTSFAASLTSLGGGFGGTTNGNGSTGGSGGGAGRSSNPGGASGSNTFAGGPGAGGAQYGTGGGGATEAGSTSPPTGGEGYTLTNIDSNLTSGNFTSLSGMTVICSGGGGGSSNNDGPAGAGGTGAGDGRGGTRPGYAYNATSYGSGGGGGANEDSAGNGFDGVVVVRYVA